MITHSSDTLLVGHSNMTFLPGIRGLIIVWDLPCQLVLLIMQNTRRYLHSMLPSSFMTAGNLEVTKQRMTFSYPGIPQEELSITRIPRTNKTLWLGLHL